MEAIMQKAPGDQNKGSIIIYRGKDDSIKLEVKINRDTVWLTQKQIALLFGIKRPAITKHLHNIFASKELREKSVCSILEHTAPDGKRYRTKFYNLDIIISVGYRVNSSRATQFRIWATKVLKDYLIKGYALNNKRLANQASRLREIRTAVNFIRSKVVNPELIGQSRQLLDIVADYTNSLTLLYQYDKKAVPLRRAGKPRYILSYDNCIGHIAQLRATLARAGESSHLFGSEISHKFESIIGGIYQTFDRKDLYGSIEEKAANLLYLIIKDHPFCDGNKRIGSVLFIYYLEKNGYLFRPNGERKISDNAIVALALLIAKSDPGEKDVMIGIITNLIK